MMRIWTYVSLDEAMQPVSAGTWFDPALADLDVEAGSNTLVQTARTGMPLLLNDPMPQLPVRGTLTVSATHVDLESGDVYDGGPCYLGPVLYKHHESHLPLVIFNYNLNLSSPKCYVARITGMDRVLAAHATDEIHAMMHLARVNMPRAFQFDLTILLDGKFADVDEVTSGTWTERFPGVT